MDKILEILNELYDNFMTAFPRILGAVVIFIVGWIIAKIVAFVIKRILSSIGVDKLAEKLNEIEFIEKSSFNIVPSALLLTTLKSLGVPSAKMISIFIFYFIFLMSVITALTQVGIDTDFISNNLSIIISGCVFAFALGYGLASKNMMANFLASFYSKEKIKIGDILTISNVKGEVIRIDSSSITLLTQNSNVIVPLSK